MSNAPGNTIEDIIIDRLEKENEQLRENIKLRKEQRELDREDGYGPRS